MPIILITGANGHGKGQFAIKKILELQDENDKREKDGKPRRQIYANIHGINQEGAKPLKDVLPIPSDKIFFGKQDNPDDPPPDGYFLPPIGSIFFYDECQKVDWIKQKSGALSNDIRVRSMEEHRHAGLDIYLITQSPNYIHSHVQGLVSPHFYVERPLGLKTTNVFMYNKFQKSPESTAIKAKADDQFMISLGEKYGQYYKSSAEHNMKSTIPLKLKLALGGLGLVILIFAYKANKSVNYYDERYQDINASISEQSKTSTSAKTPDDKSDEQTQIDKLKQELELLKAKQALQDENRRIYLMTNQLYADYQVIKSEPALQVRGVVSNGKDCKAYNTHGDLMTLTQADCEWYLKEPGRVHKGEQSVATVYHHQQQQSL